LDEGVKTAKLKENVEADRGFIITFDDVATGPKRPKPQLGAKRQPSPKKLSTYSAPSETTPVSSSPAYNHNNKSGSSRVRLRFRRMRPWRLGIKNKFRSISFSRPM
jgi:hypothetical protein